MEVVTGLAIMDTILLIAGITLFTIEREKKYKNKKATDTIWKLIEYVTMALVGSLIGGGIK